MRKWLSTSMVYTIFNMVFLHWFPCQVRLCGSLEKKGFISLHFYHFPGCIPYCSSNTSVWGLICPVHNLRVKMPYVELELLFSWTSLTFEIFRNYGMPYLGCFTFLFFIFKIVSFPLVPHSVLSLVKAFSSSF